MTSIGLILATLPLPHDDLVAIEIEIFDPKIETLLQPEARTVEQHDDQPRGWPTAPADRAAQCPAIVRPPSTTITCPVM